MPHVSLKLLNIRNVAEVFLTSFAGIPNLAEIDTSRPVGDSDVDALLEVSVVRHLVIEALASSQLLLQVVLGEDVMNVADSGHYVGDLHTLGKQSVVSRLHLGGQIHQPCAGSSVNWRGMPR